MSDQSAVGRRTLLVGAGATAFVAASLRGTDLAAAKPTQAPKAGPAEAEGQAAAAAVTPGTLLSGDVYRGVSGFDFQPDVNVGLNFNSYPAGSRLALGFQSLSGFTQIAGARVGFANGAGAAGLRDVPYRAYDSRDPDKVKFASKENRIITLPGFAAPSGTAAVIVNLTAVGAAANGYLRAYSAAEAAPTSSSMNFFADGTPIANALVVGVSAARQLRIFASTSVHVVVDVLGTIS